VDRNEYELFEYLPSGALNWRGLVRDLESARVTLALLADQTGNECYAMDWRAHEVALARAPCRGGRRIFQVAYDSKLLANRAQLLRRDGYDVTSAFGNRASQLVLGAHAPYNLFLIGHATPEPERSEMKRWLRAHYPEIAIVALNPRGEALEGLRFNAPAAPTTAWLPLICAALSQSTRAA
jgi:hypothetical protein